MNLRNNIIKIFSVNFLSMISSIVIGFIVPAVLSIEAYSNVKTYAFYISYVGCLHLGFVDGMYMKYGGKDINEIDKREFKNEHNVFIIMQVLISIIFIIIGLLKKDVIIVLMGLSIVPMNTLSFHSLFYQATGQFNEYTKVTSIYTISYLIFNILLAIVFRSQNYIYYCVINLIAYGIVFIALEIKFYKNTKLIKARYDSRVWNNIKVGVFVLLGNLSVMLFYAIDRWFVKIFLGVNDFAYYSFSISMLNIVNVLITAISVTFYNYLSKEENEEKIKKIKKYFILLGAGASLGYFGLAGIVSLFIKKYIPSLSIIAISFAAYPYMIIINSLYVNLYKARRDEKRYLRVVIVMLVVAILYNIIAIVVWKTSEAIAIATTLSFITWYIYSIKDFKYLKSNLKEVGYLSIIIIMFLVFSHYFNWFIGGIGYLIIFVVMSILFYRNEINEIIKILLRRENKK
ncbi:capsular biosynthesis protein [Clostridium saudiense]|uniref:capsular biosynthesis protein n=1 Tax=Clostridium saudiense TaxID=1414720 RepID=UPI0018AC1DDB|nr:capsular biosynthesis protein [Clostridium saudiense]